MNKRNLRRQMSTTRSAWARAKLLNGTTIQTFYSKLPPSRLRFVMSLEIDDFLQNLDTGGEIGGIDSIEAWWVERQESLERAGYMLRPHAVRVNLFAAWFLYL